MDRVLVYESCVNALVAVLQIGGVLWVMLGIVRLAGSLREKAGPGLQASIWQIGGGAALVSVAVLFKTLNFDYKSISGVLSVIGKFSSIAGLLFSIFGVIILAESLRNKNAPLLETGLWQFIGGIFVYYVSSILDKIVTLVK